MRREIEWADIEIASKGLRLHMEWVRHTGVAVWVSTPDCEIGFLNHRAEMLLEVPSEECVGEPCFEVVGARCPGGRPFCEEDCPFLQMAKQRQDIEPLTLVIDRRRSDARWIQLLVIPVWDRENATPSLVHCAWKADRAHRAEQYLVQLASRSGSPHHLASHHNLTPREVEILRHLAADEDLPEIARRLYVSHATVRNHVQHILAKLQAHSVQEAIAMYLMDIDD